MRPRVRLPGMFVLASLLAVLLGALAYLQYRWVGQLSADQRERIKDSLRDSAEDFSEDFNRELTRAFFWLQVGPEVRRDGPPDTDAQRYERWYTAAPHPELISRIYHIEVDEAGKLSLQQFVRAEPRFEHAEWPAALEPIRKAIAERSTQAAPGPGPQPVPRPPFARVAVLWPEVPAIIVPRLRVVTSTGPGATMRQILLPQPMPAGYVVAVLNESYLKQQLIPQLVERHFTKGPDGALHVAVKGEHDIVFATEGAVPKVLQHADVRESLWDIRFHEFGRFVADRTATAPASSSSSPSPSPEGGRPPDAPAGPPPLVSVFETRRPAPDRGADGRDGRRSADDRGERGARVEAPAAGTANFTVTYRGADDRGGRGGARNLVAGPGWQVHVLHSAGSLDAAVARARTRNLLVSFGVLLLLGASMTLVLISSARARRLAAQQMEFVAGVSHELRTPLAVIRSAAENLADGIVDDDKQVRRYGQLIASEGRRLTQMVEQVMTFAGLQAGRPGFDVRPIDVGPVVDDALNAVAPMAREQDAEIACEIASPLPRILADPSAVGRALQNLLGNAMKYGGDPPRITVTARQSAPHTIGRPDVEILVVDNGTGIAPRDLPHIFEPFYRGADAVARQIHGSGLGLSLVQRIMQELGGRVTVKSDPGHGSTFTLHLPIAPEAEVVSHPQGAPLTADR
jgi:signal transduction histidine kinase